MNASRQDSAAQDVIIMGGALAGAAAALLLLRQQPGLRVLLIERSPAFTRRVGEATVEISAYFLGRVLGLTQYLNEEHLVKQGMRFWFANDRTQSLEDCSEIGGSYLSRVPAYQVDRSTLDEEVLRRATAAGARLLRPAAVQKVMLAPGGEQAVTVRHGDRTETHRARWVIDATGFAAVLARQQGWWRANVAHPITAVWSRWQGVKDWDGLELAAKFPKWSMACHGIRATATNHFMGPGWWAWCIPLKGGDVSVGVVFDERMVEWPEQGALGQRLKDFLVGHPAAREILQDARWLEGDVHWRKQLPYWSAVQAGDGFVLVGDAGGFLDPLYSPGMDWLAFTVVRSTDLILAAFRGEEIAPLVERQNLEFVGSYSRWFNALYLDKYEYLGDYDLMRLGFLLDLGCYYLGVAAQPYRRGLDGLREPVFSTKPALVVYHLMRTYNRRLAAIARSRKARGTWGRANTGRRFMFGGYTFSRSSAKSIAAAFLSYAWLELTEGWRSWWNRRSPRPSPKPIAVPSAVPASPETAPVLSEAQPAATAGTASRLSRA